MIEKNDKILVGWSGGPDSTFLLITLLELQKKMGIEVSAFYLNHMLRGEESLKEEEFVRRIAERKKISLFVMHCDVKKYSKEKNLSTEVAAREVRYNLLEKIKKENGFSKVALGHTLTDSIEWFFLSLIRAKSVPLITGIPPVQGCYIRPLIEITREEIIQYLENNGIEFFTDSSNLDVSIPRNYVRLNIIPHFKKLNPSFVESMKSVLYLGERIRNFYNRINLENMRVIKEDIWLDISNILTYNPLKRFFVFKKIKNDLGSREMMEIEEMLQHGVKFFRINLKRDEGVERAYNWLVFFKGKKPRLEEKKINLGDRIEIEGLDWIIECNEVNRYNVNYDDKNYRVYFDKDDLVFPLLIRGRKPGDRILCFGMEKEKKIKEIFIENKIPARLRELWPIVISAGKIIWVPGLRRSNYGVIKENTKKVVKMEVIKRAETFPV